MDSALSYGATKETWMPPVCESIDVVMTSEISGHVAALIERTGL
jgi:hypothetical protein